MKRLFRIRLLSYNFLGFNLEITAYDEKWARKILKRRLTKQVSHVKYKNIKLGKGIQ